MLTQDTLVANAETYLNKLCRDIDNRRVGSKGNLAAAKFFSDHVEACGFKTESGHFDCMDWIQQGARLSVDDMTFVVNASPYSLGCRVSAPLIVISSLEQLENSTATGLIVLLRGDIAKQQLMPKHFPFYNPQEHQQIISVLEQKQPLAIVAATSRDLEMVGSQYPFPLIADGDFDIPSVYMTDEEGIRLAGCAGKTVVLHSVAQRLPATGCNVIARKGANTDQRIVFFAHIDTVPGTPGATDNATGVTVLLLLAELMSSYNGNITVELVAMNGEDYFSNPGEQLYLAANAQKFDEIVLGVNIDGAGYRKGNTAYSLYNAPPEVAELVHEIFSAQCGFVEGEPWYQGDHGLFLMNQRPTLAFTSEFAHELMGEYTHTPQDKPEIVESRKLVELAIGLQQLINRLA